MSRPLIVYLLGNDGSGKSTISEALASRLEKKGFRAARVWWIEGDESLLRGILRKISGRSHNPPQVVYSLRMGTDNRHIRIAAAVYPYLALLDYSIFGFKKLNMRMRASYEVLILDRYFYDVIHAISKEFGLSAKRERFIVKIMSVVLPEPNLVFSLIVPPEVSLARKPDEIGTINNAQKIWRSHLELADMLRGVVACRILELDNTETVGGLVAVAEREISRLVNAGGDECEGKGY